MKKGLLIVLISLVFASVVGGVAFLLIPKEEDMAKKLPPLRSVFVEAAPPVQGDLVPVDCADADLPPPPQDLRFESRYDPNDRSRSLVDADRDAEYKKKIQSVRDYELYISKIANIAHRGNLAAEGCVIDALYDWGAKKALLVDGASSQGKMVRGWALAAIASAYMQIDPKNIDEEKKKPIRDWIRKLARKVKQDFPDGQRRGLNNNHAYWATWAVAQAAVSLNRREDYDWALDRYRRHLEGIRDDGALPLELEREGRALMYHAFAAGPLLMMTQLVANNGDMRAQDRAAIDRLMNFIIDGINDPQLVQEKTPNKTGQEMDFLKTGGAPVALYACQTSRADAQAIVQKYELTASLSRLGGDLYQLVCPAGLTRSPEGGLPDKASPAP